MNAIYTLLILLIPFFVKSQDLIYVPDNFLEEYLESHPVFGNEFSNGISNDNFINNYEIGFESLIIQVPSNTYDLTGLESLKIDALLINDNFSIELIDLSLFNFEESYENGDNTLGGGQIEIKNNLSLSEIILPSNSEFIYSLNIENNYTLNCIDFNSSRVGRISILNNNSINSIDLNNVMIENYIENLTRITISEESLKNLNLKLNNNSYVFLTFLTIIAPQLECLEFDNIEYAINNGWDYITPIENCFGEDECSSSTSINLNYINHKRTDIISNFMGQRISIIKNQPFIKIYNDGSVEKKIIIE